MVIHPLNPFVPCSHLNVRYFETDRKDRWWFGGGYDLTPYFVYKDDVKFWHANTEKCVISMIQTTTLSLVNNDDYFYLKHRKEKEESVVFFMTIQTTKINISLQRFFLRKMYKLIYLKSYLKITVQKVYKRKIRICTKSFSI